MVTSLNVRTPAREASYEMAQYISARVTPLSTGATVAQKIGTLPAGAVITQIFNSVQTTFGGGTPLLTIGTVSPTFNDINATMSEAAANEALVPIATFVMPLAADTDVFASLSGGATTGTCIIAVAFYKPIA
jgi:hypothetical protein